MKPSIPSPLPLLSLLYSLVWRVGPQEPSTGSHQRYPAGRIRTAWSSTMPWRPCWNSSIHVSSSQHGKNKKSSSLLCVWMCARVCFSPSNLILCQQAHGQDDGSFSKHINKTGNCQVNTQECFETEKKTHKINGQTQQSQHAKQAMKGTIPLSRPLAGIALNISLTSRPSTTGV